MGCFPVLPESASHTEKCDWLVLNLLAVVIPGRNSGRYVSAYILLTATINVIVTTLIVTRILRARNSVADVSRRKDIQRYTGVASILIESALPLSVSGVVAGGVTVGLINTTQEPTTGLVSSYYIFVCLFFAFCVSGIPELLSFPNADNVTIYRRSHHI